MAKTFKQFADQINNKLPHITLIYRGKDAMSIFIDNEFGKFEGHYNRVLNGMKNHPERSKINKINKYKQTCLKKYGVENVSQVNEIKLKKQNTCFKNHGVESPLQSAKIICKLKETNIKKYGKDNPAKNNKIKIKIKNTNLEKYGSACTLNNYKVKEKAKKSFIKKYGVDNPFKSNKIQQDIRKNTKYNKKSKASAQWLKEVEFNLGYQIPHEYWIKDTNFIVDGYDPKTNTVYEFYGDYWHGYPFKNLGINAQCDNSFNTLYYKTLSRETKLKELGYKIISMWENDFFI